jgi:hypothetical protein
MGGILIVLDIFRDFYDGFDETEGGNSEGQWIHSKWAKKKMFLNAATTVIVSVEY